MRPDTKAVPEKERLFVLPHDSSDEALRPLPNRTAQGLSSIPQAQTIFPQPGQPFPYFS